MDKRQFLAATAVGAVALPAQVLAQQTPKAARSPVLLTVTGAVGKGNRGAFDPVLDQMMGKQKIKFDKAHAFDFAALAALPAVSIRPTLEYDSKPHALKGPLLTDVARAAGAPMEGLRFLLRAVDGYNVILSLADARKYGFIVATHLDGKPMPLGGLGPLWAVYDADRFADMAAKPVGERFGLCPWGLYHIEVQTA
ncbi:MAG: molybdopterin-dependent oxidoreductase [Ramlibacter sp.]|nr:molybdopterin-dependent oxidoreductase [Ramlibacter sp.]